MKSRKPSGKSKKIVVIVGPTASGKSALAVRIARTFNGEVISADSRQIYKYLDIGTGKTSKKEMSGISHHCIDITHPKKQFTVAEYKQCAEKAIEKIEKKNKFPILVGGSGFYVQAVIDNIVLPEVPPNKPLRKELEEKSIHELLTMLNGLDPYRAQTIEQKNKRRLIRAIEIVLETGSFVPKTKHISRKNRKALFIGIQKTDTEQKILLHKKLNERLRKGVLREIDELRTKHHISWKRLHELGLDYRYLSLYVRGQLKRKSAFAKLETELWRYTRRQNTWWKRDKRVHWIRAAAEAEQLVKKFLENEPPHRKRQGIRRADNKTNKENKTLKRALK